MLPASGCVNRVTLVSVTQGRMSMLRSILAAASAATLLVGVAPYAQTPATRHTAGGRQVRRQCRLAHLQCRRRHRLRLRLVEGYELPVHPHRRHRRELYRLDQEATASISASPRKRRWCGWCSRRAHRPGALAGDYGGATASATVGVGAGANVLVGGSNKQITLQPVSVEGSVGLNVAAGIASVTLKPVK